MRFLLQVLSFDRMEPVLLRSTLLHLMRTKENFYLEQFEHFYNDAMKRVFDAYLMDEILIYKNLEYRFTVING